MATIVTETYSQSSAESNAHSSSSTRVVQRRWVRRDRPVWPFVWRGLLPILGLLLLLGYAFQPFARDVMEFTVQQETRAQLDGQGHAWATLLVSGQNVTVGGIPPAGANTDAVLAAARAATCPSWAGRLTCAVVVNGDFAAPGVAPVALATPKAEPKLEVKLEPKPEATPEAKPAAPAAAAVQACEKSLADVVAQSKIEFAIGSAVIAPESGALLDSLARAAGQCPGVIRVEGHTDATGDAAANRALSEARAGSVVAALALRGISSSRLKAEGFGAEQPLADNTSAAGRAQNRRIEFRVLTGN